MCTSMYMYRYNYTPTNRIRLQLVVGTYYDGGKSVSVKFENKNQYDLFDCQLNAKIRDNHL